MIRRREISNTLFGIIISIPVFGLLIFLYGGIIESPLLMIVGLCLIIIMAIPVSIGVVKETLHFYNEYRKIKKR